MKSQLFHYNGMYTELNTQRTVADESDQYHIGDTVSVSKIPHGEGYRYAGGLMLDAAGDKTGTIVAVELAGDRFPLLYNNGDAVSFRVSGDGPICVAVEFKDDTRNFAIWC